MFTQRTEYLTLKYERHNTLKSVALNCRSIIDTRLWLNRLIIFNTLFNYLGNSPKYGIN